MKQIIPTTQYKKDLKRYANQRKKMEALLEILRCLANEEPIPENCQSISNAYKIPSISPRSVAEPFRLMSCINSLELMFRLVFKR